MNFMKVNPGTFTMGEKETAHVVTLTQPFELMDAPVTQEQWTSIMGSNPSRFCKFKRKDRPVEMVSWNDTQEFISKLNAKKDGFVYRLPTEAEWEYACRAGTTTDYSCAESELAQHAWFYANSKNKTRPVKLKKPNPWGFYDMHGNVWEWCEDWYGTYPNTVTDPKGPITGSLRVLRGGSWFNGPVFLRSAQRLYYGPGDRSNNFGFRLARTSTQPSHPLPLKEDPAAKRAEIDRILASIETSVKYLKELL